MFRWAVIGTGYVSRKFALGLKHSNGGSISLVHSRTTANAELFASDFAVPTVARTFQEALSAPDIDAFYIATPPSLHAEQAIACLSTGRPTLIEKPFATTRAEAEAIVAAAREHGTFCMEGMWTRFMPLVEELRTIIRSGAIGEPRSFSGSFGSATIPDRSDNIFVRALGGGALLHRGIYPLSMAADLLGPAELASATARLGFDGVDEDCSLVLRHSSGALSTVRASLRTALPNDMIIEGTEGTILVQAPIFRPVRMRVKAVKASPRASRGNLRVEALRESGFAQSLQQRLPAIVGLARRGAGRSVVRPYVGNGYHYEADEVSRASRAGELESRLMPLAESVALTGLMEQARSTWNAPLNPGDQA